MCYVPLLSQLIIDASGKLGSNVALFTGRKVTDCLVWMRICPLNWRTSHFNLCLTLETCVGIGQGMYDSLRVEIRGQLVQVPFSSSAMWVLEIECSRLIIPQSKHLYLLKPSIFFEGRLLSISNSSNLTWTRAISPLLSEQQVMTNTIDYLLQLDLG